MDDTLRCPCLSGLTWGECCGPLHRGARLAPTAVQLMRSRFSAFAVSDADYLVRTWHPTTRPEALDLDSDIRWYRLDIERTEAGGPLDTVGVVAFTAHYRGPDARGSQQETSRFVRENGAWFYLDGE